MEDDERMERFLNTCSGIFDRNYDETFFDVIMLIEELREDDKEDYTNEIEFFPTSRHAMWLRVAEKIKKTFEWDYDEVEINLDLVADILVSYERDKDMRGIQQVRNMIAEQGVEFTIEETSFYLSMLVAVYSSALLRKRKDYGEDA
tara:strand:+ start:3730 stop:4167 length:438 start_codon:yes stop_codon:yes gene_type:complete